MYILSLLTILFTAAMNTYIKLDHYYNINMFHSVYVSSQKEKKKKKVDRVGFFSIINHLAQLCHDNFMRN